MLFTSKWKTNVTTPTRSEKISEWGLNWLFFFPLTPHPFSWEFEESEEDPVTSIPYQLQRLFVLLQTSKKRAIETTDVTRSFGWDSSEGELLSALLYTAHFHRRSGLVLLTTSYDLHRQANVFEHPVFELFFFNSCFTHTVDCIYCKLF